MIKLPTDLAAPVSQADFGRMVGITQSTVSRLIAEGVLKAGGSGHEWVVAYCQRLRATSAGRDAADSALSTERMALAKSRRVHQELQTSVLLKEYAPIGLLSDVLGEAVSAVVDRMDMLEVKLRRRCPDLSADAMTTIKATIASARNEWMKTAIDASGKALKDLREPDEDGARNG